MDKFGFATSYMLKLRSINVVDLLFIYWWGTKFIYGRYLLFCSESEKHHLRTSSYNANFPFYQIMELKVK